jgi:hypothetical protein
MRVDSKRERKSTCKWMRKPKVIMAEVFLIFRLCRDPFVDSFQAVMAENKESCSGSEMEGTDDSVHNLIQFSQHSFRVCSFEMASNGADRVNEMENNFIVSINHNLKNEQNRLRKSDSGERKELKERVP